MRALLFLTLLFFGSLQAAVSIVAASYYDYDEAKVAKLKTIPTELMITKESLQHWDKVIEELLRKQPFVEGGHERVYAYIYTAQRDAALLSQAITGRLAGSLDPITYQVLQLFYPYAPLPFSLTTDDYSYELAQPVFANFKARFLRENENIAKEIHEFSIFPWTGRAREFGSSTLGWTPWVLSPIGSATFLPHGQLVDHKKEKKMGIGVFDYLTHRIMRPRYDHWIAVANDFLFSQEDLPLEKIILVRSILSIVLYDVIVTNARITFGDEGGGSAKSSIAAAQNYAAVSVLSYFFPNEKERFEQLANQQP